MPSAQPLIEWDVVARGAIGDAMLSIHSQDASKQRAVQYHGRGPGVGDTDSAHTPLLGLRPGVFLVETWLGS